MKQDFLHQQNQSNKMNQEADLISIKDAYNAMFRYLENLYALTKSEDLGGFLGSMIILEDGKPADPAIWGDWLEAIESAKKG